MNGTTNAFAPHLCAQVHPSRARRRLSNVSGAFIAMALMACLLSACVTGTPPDVDPIGSNYERIEVPPASGDPVVQARLAFAAEDYAHAARYFEQALERDPERKEALLGVAACYDQIGRFDLSDPFYGKASSVMPGDPTLLNNIGYSHLLRGDLRKAQSYFSRAAQRKPSDPTIDGNRRLLVEVARNVPFQAPVDR